MRGCDFFNIFATDKDIIQKINLLDDGDCFIHGDYHFGNVIVDETGKFVLIDMMNVCKGPALYDIAGTYYLLSNAGYRIFSVNIRVFINEKNTIK